MKPDLSTILIGEAKRLGDSSIELGREVTELSLGISRETYDKIWMIHYNAYINDQGTSINHYMNTMSGAVHFAEHYLDRIAFCNTSTFNYFNRKVREREHIDAEHK